MQELQELYLTIVDHIRGTEGQCVLILGPELSVNHEGIDYRAYFKGLEKSDTDITKYFPDENLFSLKPEVNSRGIRSKVKEFYSKVGDPVLLDMISRLKIPLIINACPDISLNKVFKEKGYAYEPCYFSKSQDQKFKDFPTPTKDKPGILNIFGSIELDTSLILTHDKLYSNIENLLTKKSLPEKIEFYIESASSFIFLGFRFDSWHYQLLCHRLKIKGLEKTILSSPTCSFDERVSFIMKNHFHMDFTCENPIQAIQRIIKTCEEYGDDCLRPPSEIGKFSMYISYARKDEKDPDINRESVVDTLIAEFENQKQSSIQFYRDRDELTFGDSIDSFMNRIGKGKTAIRVVSDKYLKSRFCMDEALRIYNYTDDEKRIFTVLLDDVSDRITTYKKFWRDKCETIFKDIDKSIKDTIDREELKRNNNIYLDIYGFIDTFFEQINDEVHLKIKLSDLVAEENGEISFIEGKGKKIKSFVNMVIKKLEEN